MKDEKLLSFETLKRTHLLEKQDFYRYLQLRHFGDTKMKNVTKTSTCLIELFIKAFNSEIIDRTVSCMYKGLQDLKSHSTSYIKIKWEKEGGINISEEEWTAIWREFGRKSLIRYFITPSQKSHYDNTSPVCWRNCRNQSANHYHVFWDCPVMRDYWREIHNALQNIK